MKNSPPIALAFPLVLLASTPSSQEALHRNTGDGYPRTHGFSVAAAGDVDGDGAEDYWSGASGYAFCEGAVYLISGVDGATLLRIEGETNCPWSEPTLFGFSLAGGEDLSGDGVPDVVIGVPQGQGLATTAGRIEARSGVDGALLFLAPGRATGDRFGEALAYIGDADGDGVSDLLVGAPGDDTGGNDRGSVRVVSGATGAGLGTLRGSANGWEFGRALTNAGDVDADGVADFAVGAPGAAGDTGLALVFSGQTGAQLASYPGDLLGDLFGHALADAGDVNTDGRPDLVVGAPGGKYARVLSGADGAVLCTVSRSQWDPFTQWLPHPDFFGAAVAGVGDQNGDGVDDFAVGRPRYSTVYVFSGADGSELMRFGGGYHNSINGDRLTSYLGFALARLADRNGDGAPEILAGAPNHAAASYPMSVNSGAAVVLSCRVGPRWFVEGAQVSLAEAGDANGDGYGDLAHTKYPDLRILSGRDQTVIRTLDVQAFGSERGGDIDADGEPDLLVGGIIDGLPGTFAFSVADGALLQVFPAGSFAGVGDLDGDGHDDVAIGRYDPARVDVLSGSDASVLLHVEGEPQECECFPCDEAFGRSMTGVGDWNRDGVPDLAVSAPHGGPSHGGEVRVFSGADGSVLHRFSGTVWCYGEFGISIDGGPDFDVDADGYVDLVVGEQELGYGPHAGTGSAYVFSSRTGEVVAGWWGGMTDVGYGGSVGPAYAVADAGDFDGDGHSDFVVGDPPENGLLGPGAGQVVVVSGRNGDELARATGTSSWDYLGYTVAGVGDLNGDGLSDVYATRPGELGSSGAVLLMGREPRAVQHSAPDRSASAAR